MLSKLYAVVFAALIIYAESVRPQKALLSVYYETKCSDSKKFIVGQLLPAMKHLRNDVILRLVPFGKANSTDGANGGFECQHGPPECLANMQQDCALYHMRKATDVDKVAYVACEMATQAGTRGDLQCAEKANLPVDRVVECMNNGEGVAIQLLSEYFTQQVKPTFIPTITINDVFDQQFQDLALTDLIGAVCSVSNGPFCALYHNDEALKHLFQNNHLTNYRQRT